MRHTLGKQLGCAIKPLLFFSLTLCMVLCLFAKTGPAQLALDVQKQKLKAALIYNFLKYTNWPDKTKTQLDVCLVGGDPFDGHLSHLQGRVAGNMPITIHEMPNLDPDTSCNLVYIHSSLEDYLDSILATLEGKGTLTISDIEHFTELGGMIEMALGDDKRIHIHTNKHALAASKLKIEDSLLDLADQFH